MAERPKQRWGCLQGLIVLGALLVLSLTLPFYERPSPLHGHQGHALNNCKQIILALKQYATDAHSLYPDGRPNEFKSANQVFRELFREEIISDERIFDCPSTTVTADNQIGRSPVFEEALSPGECHWMLMKGQTENSHPKLPLIIENSLNAYWPPKWDVTKPEGRRIRGQAWRGREIIIGRNDGSVAIEKLQPDGTLDWHSPPNLDDHGKSWIDYLTPEQVAQLSYWDIDEK